ncbi:hypothetical protein pb186bvf_021190 [Paramecium bursaria]
MIIIDYFRVRRRRYNLYGAVIVCLSFWYLLQGLSSVQNDYVFRDKSCGYLLSGTYKCNYLEYDDCFRNNNSVVCSKANHMHFFCYTIYYCFYHRNMNITGYLQCCYLLWLICSFICMILFFQTAKEVDDLINNSSGVYINESIKGLSLLFGILHMFHLIFQCFVNTDIHYEVIEHTRIYV